MFGAPEETIARWMTGGSVQSVRFNPLSGASRAAVESELDALGVARETIDWCPDAAFLTGDKSALAESAPFREGRVFIQNASSLVPALALEPGRDQDILDLCAAPGGKASHIAALSENRARLWLNDGIPDRVRKLESVVATLGVRTTAITCVPAQYADKEIPGPFDRILLDAQCSGEGMLDLSHPNALRFWSKERIRKYGRLQQRMLMAAWRLLRPGGLLVYSTCTFGAEENEVPLDHLLRHREDADVEPVGIELEERRPGVTRFDGRRLDSRLDRAMRIPPGPRMEGFFVCRLRKLEG